MISADSYRVLFYLYNIHLGQLEINEWEPAPSLVLPALQSACDQGCEASADPVRFVLYNVILAKAAEVKTYLVFLSQLMLKLSSHVTCNCEMLSSKL